MNKLLFDFGIDSKHSIVIKGIDGNDIHGLELIDVYFREENNYKYVLKNDYLKYSIEIFYNVLKRSTDNSFAPEFEINLENGGMGIIYHKWQLKFEGDLELGVKTDDNPTSNYSLWDKPDIQLFLYRYNEQIILEVSPVYHWADYNQETDKSIIDDFLSKYKIQTLFYLDNQTVQSWIKKSEDILLLCNK